MPVILYVGSGSMKPIAAALERNPVLALLRPQEWIKNVFVAAPVLLTPTVLDWDVAGTVALGIVAFSLVASAGYVLNDVFDRVADRQHPKKRERPLASGTASMPLAIALIVLTLAGGFGLAVVLSLTFAALLLAYVAVMALYSAALKRLAIVDISIITGGFLLRVYSGGELADVTLSVWIVLITGLLALFLALGKRRDDLLQEVGQDHRQSLGGYNLAFVDSGTNFVLGALLVAYMIYTTDDQVVDRMQTDNLPWSVPFVLAGILRYLQVIHVHERSGSPTKIALTDRPMIAIIIGWISAMAFILYAN